MNRVTPQVRLALRGLARRPWGVAGVTLSLALAFAVQVTVLSCANSVLWKPLSVPEPSRIATIYGYSRLTAGLTNIAYPQLERLSRLPVFESVSAFTRFTLTWETEERSEALNVEMAGAGYFDVLRPAILIGRAPAGPGEVMLAHSFWKRRFQAARHVIGLPMRLGGARYEVVGVMGPGFQGTLLDYMGDPKLWLTVDSQDRLPFLKGQDLRRSWVLNWFVGAARLRPGFSASQAQEAVSASERDMPVPVGAARREARVVEAGRMNFHPSSRPSVSRTLTFCLASAGLLLLLGCLNAGFFLSGKALAETNQTAVELALGASRTGIAARRFGEAGLLWLLALAPGTAFAAVALRLLETYPPPLAHIVLHPAWDGRVWLAAAGWVALGAVLAGFAPAVMSARAGLPVHGVPSGPGRASWRFREVLVALQIGVAAVILVAACALLRTVSKAHSTDLGFAARGLVMAEADLYSTGAGAASRSDTIRRVLSRLAGHAGVEQAAAASLAPLTVFRIPDRVRTASGATAAVYSNSVSDSYFATLRLPLLDGRTFGPGRQGAGEAVVNRTLARLLAPGGNAIGLTLDALGEDETRRRRFTIVGVAADARYHTLWQEHVPYFYVSFEADPGANPSFIVRSRAPADPVWRAVRDAVRSFSPAAVVTGPRTGSSQLAALIREQSWLLAFFGIAGAVALLVAAGGLVANLYLMVSQKTREIGIRQALGASQASVVRGVIGRGLAVAGAGAACGLAFGVFLPRWLRPLAPGYPSSDTLPLMTALAFLALVAFAAVLGPALRAARQDPWSAIRHAD